MATMARDAWTDERLDDLNAKVDRLDERLSSRIDRLDERMERGFADVRGEIATLNRSFQQLTWGLIGAMLVGFLSTAAAIVTQL